MMMLFALDKLMHGQCPKKSKRGGIPNCRGMCECAHEPRKILPLGTMLNNEVDFKSGAIVRDHVVHYLEQQSRNKYSKEKTIY